VRGVGGGLYAGCNIENAAYPLGQCAEAGAIAAMLLDGETRIAEVVVLGPGEALCTPCGGCRQRLREFAGPAVPVHICGPAGVQLSTTLGALLPHAFGPANLAPDDVGGA
jgi:cytidine deaminase